MFSDRSELSRKAVLVPNSGVGDAEPVLEASQRDNGELVAGDLIGGRYRVDSEIGSGAMGRVYRVVHQALELPLALKIIHPDRLRGSSSAETKQRLMREARLSALMDHPCVVRVTDFGVHDGRPFLVMRLIEGEELSRRMALGPMDPTEVVDIAERVLDGLEHAHGHGLIHRDLKPENIILTERGPRILDFGLARAISNDDPRLTRTGMVCGTPRYMAPEQASGDKIDERIDLYALGVLMYEMLSGGPLFDGPSAAAVLRRQIVDQPEPLNLPQDPEIDVRRLAQVVNVALAKAPSSRFASAQTFRDALRQCRQKRSPWRTRRARILGAAIALVLLAGVGYQVAKYISNPIIQARQALQRGDLATAERRARMHLTREPLSADALMLLGYVSVEQGQLAQSVRLFDQAFRIDPTVSGDQRLLHVFPDLVKEIYADSKWKASRAQVISYVETLSARAPIVASGLLAALLKEAPDFALRRRVYEGLERLGATNTIDAFEILSLELEKNGTDRCSLRRWYLVRLLNLDDPRAELILAREAAKRRDSCLEDLVRSTETPASAPKPK